LHSSATVSVYADLPGLCASDSSTSNSSSIFPGMSYYPDIVLYNESSNLVAMLELTCPLDSVDHLNSARVQKQEKREYQELQSELDHLGIPCIYDTVK